MQEGDGKVCAASAIANGTKSLKQRFFNPSQKLDDPAHAEFWTLKDVSFEVKQGDRVDIRHT